MTRDCLCFTIAFDMVIHEGGDDDMSEPTKINKKKTTHTVSPVAAGIAGVVAGGMAVAAAVALGDKKNQKKIKAAWNETKETMSENMGSVIERIKQKINKKKI